MGSESTTVFENPIKDNGSGSEIVQYGTMEDNVTCVSRKSTSFLLFSAIPSLSILINIVVLLAVALDGRRLLRQSRVYAHVSSTLIANVTFSIFALVQILSLYFNFEGHGDDSRIGYQGVVKAELAEWWAFRKAFLYGMYIIMCGNIGLLIGAIRSSTCIALRSAAGAVHIRPTEPSKWDRTISIFRSRQISCKSHDTSVPSSRVTRRRRSYLSIMLLWIIPLAYVLAPSLGWSCARDCTCLSSCFTENQLRDPPVRGCSRAFPPMANSWLALTIGIWAMCLLGVIVLLRRSVVVLRRMKKKHRPLSDDVVFANGKEECLAVNDDTKTDLQCDGTPFRVASVMTDTLEYDTKMRSMSERTDEYPGAFSENDAEPEGNAENILRTCQSCRNSADSCSDRKSPNNQEISKKAQRNRTNRTSTLSGVFNFDGRALLRRRSRPVTKGFFHLLEMSSNLKYVIWLTVAYAICTAPPMAYLTADMIFTHLKLNMVVLNMCLLFPFIYCFICPFLLAKCLPGVKTSLVHLIFRMCTFTTTVKKVDSTLSDHSLH